MLIKIGDEEFDTANIGKPIAIILREDEVWNLQQFLASEENYRFFVFPPGMKKPEKEKFKQSTGEPIYGGNDEYDDRAKGAIRSATKLLNRVRRGEEHLPKIETE